MADPDDIPDTGSGAFERVSTIDSHPADGDLHSAEEAKVAFGISPEDGLPMPVTTPWEAHLVPGLSPDTLICMEDSIRFVLRDAAGAVVAEFPPEEVRRGSDGRVTVDRVAALEKLRKKTVRSLLRFAVTALREGSEVEVEPLRKQCRYYARQMVDFPGASDNQMVLRMCTAKRTEGGEFESVREALIFACELRDPPMPESGAILRAFDEKKIAAARARGAKLEYKFDLDAAVAADESRVVRPPETAGNDLAAGGIFRSPGT